MHFASPNLKIRLRTSTAYCMSLICSANLLLNNLMQIVCPICAVFLHFVTILYLFLASFFNPFQKGSVSEFALAEGGTGGALLLTQAVVKIAPTPIETKICNTSYSKLLKLHLAKIGVHGNTINDFTIKLDVKNAKLVYSNKLVSKILTNSRSLMLVFVFFKLIFFLCQNNQYKTLYGILEISATFCRKQKVLILRLHNSFA